MEQRKYLNYSEMYRDFNLNIFLIDYIGTEITDNFTHVFYIDKKLWYEANALQPLRIVMPFRYKNNQMKLIDKI